QQILDSHLDELSDDPWHGSANGVWGSVMVGALLFGAIAAGSMMESGTAAWALSNGWSRRSWVRVFLLTTVVWVVVVYLIAVPAHWVGTRWWLGSFGISVPASMPGWAVIAPIPGLLFYAMLATTLGLLF